MIVIKSSRSKQLYSRDKLTASIVRSSSKSQISTATIDSIIDKVETEMYKDYTREIPSQVLGEMVMRHLRQTDSLAYLRYASIFKKFTSVLEFIEEVKNTEDSILGLEYYEETATLGA